MRDIFVSVAYLLGVGSTSEEQKQCGDSNEQHGPLEVLVCGEMVFVTP